MLKKVVLPNREEIAYRISGNGQETLVLVHGNLVSSKHWGSLLERLSDDFRVIAIDLRGAGESSYNNEVESFKDWAEDIKMFCDELDLKDFTLLGWSMGGGISQQFVVDNPSYAKKLILFASIPPSGYPYPKKGPNGEFLDVYYDNKEELYQDPIQFMPMMSALETNNKVMMKGLMDLTVFNINKPEEKEYEDFIEDSLKTKNLKGAAWGAQTFNISHINNGVLDGTGEVDKVGIPVLLLAGEKDILCPIPMQEFTKGEIGENAVLEIIPNAGHAIHYDNEDLVVEKIVNFIHN